MSNRLGRVVTDACREYLLRASGSKEPSRRGHLASGVCPLRQAREEGPQEDEELEELHHAEEDAESCGRSLRVCTCYGSSCQAIVLV